MQNVGKSPIVRVLDLEEKKVCSAYKKEIIEAERKTIMFGEE